MLFLVLPEHDDDDDEKCSRIRIRGTGGGTMKRVRRDTSKVVLMSSLVVMRLHVYHVPHPSLETMSVLRVSKQASSKQEHIISLID